MKRKPSGEEPKNYTDWDASFVAPMRAVVPREMGGARLDQALAKLFPQYSRNRLQAWLDEGHIRLAGTDGALRRNQPVSGGEEIVLTPPAVPSTESPRAQRMALKVVHEDDDLIVLDKDGNEVTNAIVRVASDVRQLTTVFYGVPRPKEKQPFERHTFSCAPVCEKVISVGDAEQAFGTATAQIQGRTQFATGQ